MLNRRWIEVRKHDKHGDYDSKQKIVSYVKWVWVWDVGGFM